MKKKKKLEKGGFLFKFMDRLKVISDKPRKCYTVFKFYRPIHFAKVKSNFLRKVQIYPPIFAICFFFSQVKISLRMHVVSS